MKFILLLLMSQTLSAATIGYNQGFEAGDPAIKCSNNCPIANTESKFTGLKGGDFYLNRATSGTSFMTMMDVFDFNNDPFETEYWLGFNYKWNIWATDKDTDIAPIEFHVRPSSWGGGCPFGNSYNHAPLFMTTAAGQEKIVTYPGVSRSITPVVTNKWYGMVFHYRFSKTSTGYIEAWRDGVKLFRVDGANTPSLDNCNQPVRTPWLKLGIYKWNWKDGRPPTDTSVRQVYGDNFKIARGSDGYDLVYTPVTSEPMISNIKMVVTDTTAAFTWDTDKPSDSLVKYGETSDYGGTSDNAALVTTGHSVLIVGLKEGATYHYQLLSKDSALNIGKSDDLTFTTDVNSITGVCVKPIAREYEISWQTKYPAISSINYGLSTLTNPDLTNNHRFVLIGLNPDNPYSFKISGRNPISGVISIPGCQ
jgi:hypothetical protein